MIKTFLESSEEISHLNIYKVRVERYFISLMKLILIIFLFFYSFGKKNYFMIFRENYPKTFMNTISKNYNLHIVIYKQNLILFNRRSLVYKTVL